MMKNRPDKPLKGKPGSPAGCAPLLDGNWLLSLPPSGWPPSSFVRARSDNPFHPKQVALLSKRGLVHNKIVDPVSLETVARESNRQPTPGDGASTQRRTLAFICYSVKERSDIEPLLQQLSIVQSNLDSDGIKLEWFIDFHQISDGEEFKKKIQAALTECHCAILCLSGDFYNSSFIKENELPSLLERRRRREIDLFPIVLKETSHDSRIEKLHIRNRKSPVQSKTDHQKGIFWSTLAGDIEKVARRRAAEPTPPIPDPRPQDDGRKYGLTLINGLAFPVLALAMRFLKCEPNLDFIKITFLLALLIAGVVAFLENRWKPVKMARWGVSSLTSLILVGLLASGWSASSQCRIPLCDLPIKLVRLDLSAGKSRLLRIPAARVSLSTDEVRGLTHLAGKPVWEEGARSGDCRCRWIARTERKSSAELADSEYRDVAQGEYGCAFSIPIEGSATHHLVGSTGENTILLQIETP